MTQRTNKTTSQKMTKTSATRKAPPQTSLPPSGPAAGDGPSRHRIVRKPLSDLNPAAYNPRSISDRALGGLTKSIQRFGCVEPIVYNQRTGHVVGGHQRLKVLIAAGHTETDVVAVDLPLSEEKALNLALNSPAIAGEFDDQLDDLLDQVQHAAPDLYADLLLADLRSQDPETTEVDEVDEVEAGEPQDDTVSRVGDVWLMGDHRLVCGESCEDNLISLAAAGQLDRVCYGVELDPKYCDVICRRYLKLTGDSPVRERDGAKFTDLTERSPS